MRSRGAGIVLVVLAAGCFQDQQWIDAPGQPLLTGAFGAGVSSDERYLAAFTNFSFNSSGAPMGGVEVQDLSSKAVVMQDTSSDSSARFFGDDLAYFADSHTAGNGKTVGTVRLWIDSLGAPLDLGDRGDARGLFIAPDESWVVVDEISDAGLEVLRLVRPGQLDCTPGQCVGMQLFPTASFTMPNAVNAHDGTHVGLELQPQGGTTTEYWILDTMTAMATKVETVDLDSRAANHSTLAFTVDGSRFACPSASGHVTVVDTSTLQVLPFATTDGPVLEVDFIDPDHVLVLVGEAAGDQLFEVTTTGTTAIGAAADFRLSHPATGASRWLFASDAVPVPSGTIAVHKVDLIDLFTGTRTTLAMADIGYPAISSDSTLAYFFDGMDATSQRGQLLTVDLASAAITPIDSNIYIDAARLAAGSTTLLYLSNPFYGDGSTGDRLIVAKPGAAQAILADGVLSFGTAPSGNLFLTAVPRRTPFANQPTAAAIFKMPLP